MVRMIMKRKKHSFTQWLGIACIFSVFLDKAMRGTGLPFDFYYYYPIFILFLLAQIFQTGKLAMMPRWFNLGLGIIFISGFFVSWYNDLLGMEYLKQVIGIIFSSFVYYNVLYVFNFNIRELFEKYLTIAFFVALHGVVDNLLHIAGIHLTPYIISGPLQVREYGIMGEPFYLAMALTPAVVYYLCYFKRTWQTGKFRLIILLLCYLITYSSTAVFGICLGVFFSLYLNDFFSLRKSKVVLAPLLIIPAFLLISSLIDNVDLINARFNDTTNLFFSSGIDVEQAGESNSSTFALYSNYVIARDSFLENPLFGSGLGSHPLIFEETFLKYFPQSYLDGYGAQNQQDANSKFLRLMSETGLIGLALFLWFVIRNTASKSKFTDVFSKELGAINYAACTYIILGLIRNGNYVNIGFFLFFFLLYYSNKQIERAFSSHRSQRLHPA